MSPYYCYIGPYNAHCWRTESGEWVREDHGCHFCGAPDPGEESTP